jgi:hypothetical protein
VPVAESPEDAQKPDTVERVNERVQGERGYQAHPLHDGNLNMMSQAISLTGAFLVLGAYFALQRRWLASEHRLFNAMNFVGAGLLTWVAAEGGQLGLILVEGVWALLSLPGTIRRRNAGRGKAEATPGRRPDGRE